MKHRLFGMLSAAVVALTTVTTAGLSAGMTASAASVGDKLSVSGGQTQHKGNCDGYSYEVWLDNTGGSGSMTLGKGATFKAEWNASVNRGNFLARRGLDFGSKKKATDYDYIGMDYKANYQQTGSASGNSRLCVYGWFQNQGAAGNVPLVEYYIIEDWVDWCPDGQGTMVTIDGAQYKIFQNDHTGPSINSGNETFKQYFSVRQDKRTSGHITVSEHFKAWEKQGWGIGNLYEVALNAEGWQSSGVADVTELDVYTDPSKAGTGNTGSNDPAPSYTQPASTQPAQQPGGDWNPGQWNPGGDWNPGQWNPGGDWNPGQWNPGGNDNPGQQNPGQQASGQKLTVGNGQNQHKGNSDGYSYEIWLDNTGGSGSMTLGKGATFKAEWSASVPSGNFLARRGLDFGSTKKATDYPYIGMDYEATYKQTGSASGNSRLCVYGWFQNQGAAGNVPLVEYYIIEDWVDWCPDGQGKLVTIDGAQYKIFQLDHTGPSINSGNETFKQYFSVRQDKRTSGHITVSEHFKAWANEGWGIGNLYEVALNAEGWQSSGVADITKLDVYTTQPGGSHDDPVTTGTQPSYTQPVNTQATQPSYTQPSYTQPSGSGKSANGQKLSVGNGQTQHKGVSDGFSYEIWLDNTGGSGSMTLGEGATFKAEWDASVSRGNFLARRGLDFGSTKKATDYDYIGMDYTANYKQTGSAQGNSRLCVYGWFQNKGAAGNVPLVEYYIIEDWVDWCPDAQGKMVTIDGAQYKIFQMDHTGPTINGGSETFKQYFSVRQDKRTSGHITVSEHFKAWENEGWGIGNLYEVALNAEGWQSSGVADITELNVYTTRPTDTPVSSEIAGTTPVNQPATSTEAQTTAETVTVTKKGDVNCDGQTTVADAILLARIVAEDTTVKVTDKGKAQAELDGKAGLSSDDVTELLKMIAGIE